MTVSDMAVRDMTDWADMFASASTFKVELDECSKILREAGPSSLVILDGRY